MTRLADDNIYALDYLLTQQLLPAEVDHGAKEIPLMVDGIVLSDDHMDEETEGEWIGLDAENGDVA